MNNNNAILLLYIPLILWISMVIRFTFFYPWYFFALFTFFFYLGLAILVVLDGT